MKNTIKNDIVSFVSDSFNVEPWYFGFLDENVNYFWRPAEMEKLGTAVCFPLLGMLPDNRYALDGKSYSMPGHGFAQNYNYNVAEITSNRIVYEITDDEFTYAMYPYRFRLRVVYSLQEATLRTEYHVLNRDGKEMLFSVGGHPRYACPAGDNGDFDDHFIVFEEQTEVNRVVKYNAPFSEIEACWAEDGMGFRLNDCIFKEGCFCLYPAPSGAVTLKSRVGRRSLRMDVSEPTHLQFWASPGSPFLCIEPWFGSITSIPPREYDGDWRRRPGTLAVQPGDEKTFGYNVTIAR